MARPLRIEYPGALYHITSRGNCQADIYLSDEDLKLFLQVLEDVCERFNWYCYAYCLMGNHYHLLIETPEGNLSRGMRHLNGVYTQRFNRVHQRVGHVFQGRFKAILVDKDSYLLELCRYIVVNPVRAGMVRSVKDWPWSSYRATAGLASAPTWLGVDWLLASFAVRKNEAQERYRKYVAEGKGQSSPWELLRNQVYLGSDSFVEKHIASQESDKDLSEIPLSQRRRAPKAISSYEHKARDRNEAISLAYASGGYTLKEIGDYFGLHYSRVSRIIERAKNKT